MVDITDLKSVADMACEFESRWGHQYKEKAMNEDTSILLSIATLITITVVANFVVSLFT